MSDKLFDNIDIECPNCNKELSISINSVGSSIICPHCQQTIELKDNGITDALDKAESEINDFLDNIKF